MFGHKRKTVSLHSRLTVLGQQAETLRDDATEQIENLTAAALALNEQIGISARVRSAAYALLDASKGYAG